MTRILTVCGTRPEIIRLSDWEQEVIFTGQHFSHNMGQAFLTDRGIGNNFKVHFLPYDIDHSDTCSVTKEIVKKIESIGRPDIILVHGDTRSALAGAYAAHKVEALIAHTEAGVRCGLSTVEEQIRKTIDKMAHYNFCPIPLAVENLRQEGITEGVYFVGDTLYDRFLKVRGSWDFIFLTIHRQENIENKDVLQSIIDSIPSDKSVIFPVHPHTQKSIEKFDIKIPHNFVIKPPLNHKETLNFIKDASVVYTDSGGVEREAYWSGTPCVSLRERTEWKHYTTAFGAGDAGEKIRKILEEGQPYRKFNVS